MADGVDFSLTGMDDVLGKMRELKVDARLKGGRFAARKAAQVMLAAAQENASRIDDPATANSIEKNLALRFSGRRFKQTGDIMFRVGVMGGARSYADTKENRRKSRVGARYRTDGDKSNPGGDTWYWRLVELGTSRMPANPFMRPALERNISQVIDTFATQYDKALDRAIRRAKKLQEKG